MPPRLPVPLRPHGRHNVILKGYPQPERLSVCLFCSFASDLNLKRVARRPKTSPSAHSRRFESTSTTTPDVVKIDTRKELESALLELGKHASNHVNLSRLQLALNGLRQSPGHESIRVAILGLITDSTNASTTAKDILRLLFADAWRNPEAWEEEVEDHDLTTPLIIRIDTTQPLEGTISLTVDNQLREIRIPSAALGGHSLELLVAGVDVPASDRDASDRFEEKALVPTVNSPTPSDDRYAPIRTPVHKALLVADGLQGAASLPSTPSPNNDDVLKYAANFPDCGPDEPDSLPDPLPFTRIDTGSANMGLTLVRKSVSNAADYERLRFVSNIPVLEEWLGAGVITNSDGVTKPPVRNLIVSLLENASASIRRTEEGRQLHHPSSPTDKHVPLKTIETGLSEWAESAHTELQEQLDLAFSSKRWKRLGWWKLFWRVDDVGMLTSDILTQRFLPQAERSSIFLAGRMKEAGVELSTTQSDTAVTAGDEDSTAVVSSDSAGQSRKPINWPMNIPNARSYLLAESVPALQALAQKLVAQTLSTSGMMTALGALVYVGTLTTTIYEAGAVAALGIVWSMKRMQKQWEAARKFWEGEVREEGRKAVRGVEQTMGSALEESIFQEGRAPDTQDSLKVAKDLVSRAKELLGQLK
ncbi:hypothetical protein GGR50DRAFT_485003 [Xylaria sp. CBS 124048]|nr:hypothetical protein GGR50DRAFT_485003 [Xylaria sp. CBS 124048]